MTRCDLMSDYIEALKAHPLTIDNAVVADCIRNEIRTDYSILTAVAPLHQLFVVSFKTYKRSPQLRCSDK